MSCVSGKTSYESEELAKEALIQNRIQKDHREGSGPINIYECTDCGQWHFTSKGEIADFLIDEETIQRIEKERKLFEWARKYGN